MLRGNKNKALALLDENERGMISKLADRCNSLEPMETRTCKAGDFTLIAKQSDIGGNKEIHLMAFLEDAQKYEYVADAYMNSAMDKSNYFQFFLNAVGNYKIDREMDEEALDVYKENARNLFPGEELSFAFGGQLTISVLNKGDVNRIGQNKYVISITTNFLKNDQEEVLEKDLNSTIDKFYDSHKEDVRLATKAQHVLKLSLNLSEKGAAQFIYENEYFVVTRNETDAATFDLSYGNTKEGFLRAKQLCLQDKDFENTVAGLTPLALSKNVYEYLQKCEMTKLLASDMMKILEAAPGEKPKEGATGSGPKEGTTDEESKDGTSGSGPKESSASEESKKNAAAGESGETAADKPKGNETGENSKEGAIPEKPKESPAAEKPKEGTTQQGSKENGVFWDPAFQQVFK